MQERVGQFEIQSLILANDEWGHHSVYVERRTQRDGSARWVVKELGEVLNRDGEWEYEPMPSERDGDWKGRCQYASLREAVSAWEAWATIHRTSKLLDN